jgi:Fe-S cluster biogenesis protein NfuA
MNNLKERVSYFLRTEVGPALELDGTAIEVVDVTDNIIQLRLAGACAGCPATIVSLIMGLERELKARIPEIEYIEAVP